MARARIQPRSILLSELEAAKETGLEIAVDVESTGCGEGEDGFYIEHATLASAPSIKAGAVVRETTEMPLDVECGCVRREFACMCRKADIVNAFVASPDDFVLGLLLRMGNQQDPAIYFQARLTEDAVVWAIVTE